jgi:hypothetical protein
MTHRAKGTGVPLSPIQFKSGFWRLSSKGKYLLFLSRKHTLTVECFGWKPTGSLGESKFIKRL